MNRLLHVVIFIYCVFFVFAGSSFLFAQNSNGWGVNKPWDTSWAVSNNSVKPPPKTVKSWLTAYPIQTPRTYSDTNLDYVMMPIGGIGTGSIWLDGKGRQAVWQIFNNNTEIRVPCSFFAVRAEAENGKSVTKVLQTVPEPGFTPMEGLTFEGGYPIAVLRFSDSELPVDVRMEAFNPMIPIDTAASSIPCAVFRITAKNPAASMVKVSFLASLQNAVGNSGSADVVGIEFSGYGGNLNELVRKKNMTAVNMRVPKDKPAPGFLTIRDAADNQVEKCRLLWIDNPAGARECSENDVRMIENLVSLADSDNKIVITNVSPQFLNDIKDAKSLASQMVVFDDFESGRYEGWTVVGEAFGTAPAKGTIGTQTHVTGYLGEGLVNSFLPDDGPQGEMISREFTIDKRYIGMLIGGGGYSDSTYAALVVDGKEVRRASGRFTEHLDMVAWDVSDLKGKQAAIRIVDRNSGGWGHINVDHIVFTDLHPRMVSLLLAAADKMHISYESVESAYLPDGAEASRQNMPAPISSAWKVTQYSKIMGFQFDAAKTISALPNGDPVILSVPFGRSEVFLCLAQGMPWDWISPLIAGSELGKGMRIVPIEPYEATWYGTMTLATASLDASACDWADSSVLAAEFNRSGKLSNKLSSEVTAAGRTINGALSVTLDIPPKSERTVSFVITWNFPNVERFAHKGNIYSRRFKDALAAADYVISNIDGLWERTLAYHDTLYQSNLPPEWLDACASQSVIVRGPTAWWSADGYFGAYEGSYSCCPLNCTHVWNYAQTHARLFPDIARNMRESDFLVYMYPTGEISHRQHMQHGAFIDGQCASISAVYREYQLSSDKEFLARLWPSVKKAVDWLIERIDSDHDGVPSGRQPNTYDCDTSGANTFIGSQYLCALRAGAAMAEIVGDASAARKWRMIADLGSKNQDDVLWNGRWFIQKPDPQPANDYGVGCHSDQLLGQWWAHMLNLGYLYPQEHVRSALESVMKNNFREKFAGFVQSPRRYVLDDEGGLIICTWPDGGRPNPFIVYADEVWTGIEYSSAGAMIFEGLVDYARKIVSTARSRYDGRRRDRLDSGPGGNPFNELECGKFYARAMSSWGLLIAAQGLVIDGPKGVIGFKPRWQPGDHRSFFSAPEGWGLFIQKRNASVQTERIEVRHGRLSLTKLVFEVPAWSEKIKAEVKVDGRKVDAVILVKGREVYVSLPKRMVINEGSYIEVRLARGK